MRSFCRTVVKMKRAGKKKVGRRRRETRICDLPPDLVGEKILTRIPITSLGAVRSTCKLWNALTKDWVLGKASAARKQFLGFITMDSRVCSIRSHLNRSKDKEDEEDLIDISIKQVELLNQVDISKVFHCDGLLLCVVKDHSRLVVWNPYLGQTNWIAPRTNFQRLDIYALGYDKNNHNHKILRFLGYYVKQEHPEYEIYDLSTNSWRVLNVTPDWEIEDYQRGASLKGNTYFFAHEKIGPECDGAEVINGDIWVTEIKDFLLCFDFTTERFGQRLPLPFHSYSEDTVALSCVREEQLAVLYQEEGRNYDPCHIVHIWVTTKIEPNSVSWSKFLRVEMKPFALTGIWLSNYCGSFFIDEEEKVAVVFDLNGYLPTENETVRYHTAFIIGEEGYFKSVSLGVAPKVRELCPISGGVSEIYHPPLVCSSAYCPSLVQLN